MLSILILVTRISWRTDPDLILVIMNNNLKIGSTDDCKMYFTQKNSKDGTSSKVRHRHCSKFPNKIKMRYYSKKREDKKRYFIVNE